MSLIGLLLSGWVFADPQQSAWKADLKLREQVGQHHLNLYLQDANGLRPELPRVWLTEGKAPENAEDCQALIERLKLLRVPSSSILSLSSYRLVTLASTGELQSIDPLGGFGGSRLEMAELLPGFPDAFAVSPHALLSYHAAEQMVRVFGLPSFRRIGNWKSPSHISFVAYAAEKSSFVLADQEGLYEWPTKSAEPKKLFSLVQSTRWIASNPRGDRFLLEENGQPVLVNAIGRRQALKLDSMQQAIWSNSENGFLAVDKRGRLLRVGSGGETEELTIIPGIVRPWRVAIEVPNTSIILFAGESSSEIARFDLAERQWLSPLAASNVAEMQIGSNLLLALSRSGLELSAFPLQELTSARPVPPRLLQLSGLEDAGTRLVSLPGSAMAFVLAAKSGSLAVYHEGMNALGGSFQIPGKQAKHLFLAAPLLRRSPGLSIANAGFEAEFSLDHGGPFTVAIQSAQPATAECLPVIAQGAPAPVQVFYTLSLLSPLAEAIAGPSTKFPLQVKLMGLESQPTPAQILEVLLLRTDGGFQRRFQAVVNPAGVVSFELAVFEPGDYMLVFSLVGVAAEQQRFPQPVIRFNPQHKTGGALP